MDLAIPVPALGILTLLGFLSPLVIAIINQPFWKPTTKRIVSVLGALVLAAVSLFLYYAITAEPLPSWPVLLLLAIVVSQASYALVLKKPATAIENATSGS